MVRFAPFCTFGGRGHDKAVIACTSDSGSAEKRGGSHHAFPPVNGNARPRTANASDKKQAERKRKSSLRVFVLQSHVHPGPQNCYWSDSACYLSVVLYLSLELVPQSLGQNVCRRKAERSQAALYLLRTPSGYL